MPRTGTPVPAGRSDRADDDITLLRKKLGVFDEDIKKKDHNLSLSSATRRPAGG